MPRLTGVTLGGLIVSTLLRSKICADGSYVDTSTIENTGELECLRTENKEFHQTIKVLEYENALLKKLLEFWAKS